MGSKKFKGKTCAYCCRERASEAKEHVIAREFLLTRYRDNLPAVPTCKRCNAKKSALETLRARRPPIREHVAPR